jgi:hypothetical protein
VLVAALDLGHGGSVDAALVGEGGPTDVRLPVVRGEVGDLGDGSRELGELVEAPAACGDEREIGLEGEVCEDADHVRVAAALAVAVDRGLDMADPGLDGGDRVGHGKLGVVVGVDPPCHRRRAGIRAERRLCLGEHLEQPPRQRAAVRVAQDERPGTGIASRTQGRQRIAGVRGVAIEEVLRVVDELPAALHDEADAVRDHVEVLGRRRPEDLGDVEQPALAEDRHHRRLGTDELLEVGVARGSVGSMARGAERGEPGRLPGHALRGAEELDVLGVRARPAALDVGHAVFVEHSRDAELVGQGERDVLALRSVAERGVVQDHRVAGPGGGRHRCRLLRFVHRGIRHGSRQPASGQRAGSRVAR